MRIYIDGDLSTKQTTFIPAVIWFATEDCEDNTTVSENCFCLSGIECESSCEELDFSARWKGVDFEFMDDQGNYVAIRDTFSITDVMNRIKEKNMRLVNMGAYYDEATSVSITSLEIHDGDEKVEFDLDIIDEIEFVMEG